MTVLPSSVLACTRKRRPGLPGYPGVAAPSPRRRRTVGDTRENSDSLGDTPRAGRALSRESLRARRVPRLRWEGLGDLGVCPLRTKSTGTAKSGTEDLQGGMAVRAPKRRYKYRNSASYAKMHYSTFDAQYTDLQN